MKLIGLMLARNEDWVLNLSARVALRWCDELVIVDHASTDGTHAIIQRLEGEYPWRVHYSRWQETKKVKTKSRFNGEEFEIDMPDYEAFWDEMAVRQHSLDLGRRFGGTHFAMIDADEVVTANLLPVMKEMVGKLQPGKVLSVPMIPVWGSLDDYRNDGSVWSSAQLSVAFADADGVSWKPAEDGYHHHHRCPYGTSEGLSYTKLQLPGGVMHLQFANKRRLLAKHVLYRMVDHLRWPGRETVPQLNWKYDQALDEAAIRLSACSPTWWQGYDKKAVKPFGIPWQEGEVRRLLGRHGKAAFEGLDLKGLAS